MANALSFRNLYVLAIVAGVLALDQLTKRVVVQNLALGESWPAEGFFRITRVANTGSAFGLFGGHNALLTAASILGVAVILWFLRTSGERALVRASLGLMLAGAVGNLIDRVSFGHVVDFIDVGPWYIFNVADSAIVVGVAALVFAALASRGRQPDAPEDAAPDANADADAEQTDDGAPVSGSPGGLGRER